MEKSKKSAYTVLAIILLLFGIAVDAVVLTNQNQQLLLDEEEQLSHLAQSIDINIRSSIISSKITLNSEQGRYSTRTAEQAWLWRSQSDELLSRLQTNVVEASDYIGAVVVIRRGVPLISTDGFIDYGLNDFETNDILLPCTRDDGSLSLMLLSEEDEYKVRYGAVIDVDALYRNILSSDISSEKWVLLCDSMGQILIHKQDDGVTIDSIESIDAHENAREASSMLAEAQNGEAIKAGKYEYYENDGNTKHVAYMYVIPSILTKNSFFAVGVASQIDGKIKVKNTATLGYVLGTMLFAVSLALFTAVIRTHKREERAQIEELEILRQKNEEMAILEKKRKDLAHLDRLETIGTLTSGIAHEFNNLLTPIMAYSLMALEKLPPEEDAGEYLEEIYNASKRAKSVVSRVSDLSRNGAEKIYAVISISSVIDKACESAAPARPENVELEKDYSENTDALVNELQIHQMMLNLILNAYHAMTPKGGKLLIRTRSNEDSIIITVADSGPGIDASIADKIFDPFFTTKDHNQGTGLGLAICMQTVEDHKGELKLIPSELGGACFEITIPRAIAMKI